MTEHTDRPTNQARLDNLARLNEASYTTGYRAANDDLTGTLERQEGWSVQDAAAYLQYGCDYHGSHTTWGRGYTDGLRDRVEWNEA